MDFKAELDRRCKDSWRVIEKYIPVSDSNNKEIIQAMSYSISAGGKRLRPILIQAFYNLFGQEDDVVEPFMAAMEMLHTYSLVHDDLPALDNDDYRRGVPTTHKKFGETVGILAGDGLLHLSYETAIKAFDKDVQADNVIKALKIFGNKTGLYGMFGGQAADVINTGREISDDLLFYIYKNKTGALIEGSMMIGAALAGASDEEIAKIEGIGLNIGMAFQIRDDILDMYGNEELLGKPINSDEKNNKKTYLSVNGLTKAQNDIDRLTDEAVNTLKLIGNNERERIFLTKLFKYLVARDI